jgi:hypothetical protein
MSPGDNSFYFQARGISINQHQINLNIFEHLIYLINLI